MGTLATFFTEIDKLILKFTRNCRRLQIAKAILIKNKGELTHCHSSHFRESGIGIRIDMETLGDRTESLEINPHIYNDQRIFNKGCQDHSVRRSKDSSTNGAGTTGSPHAKE